MRRFAVIVLRDIENLLDNPMLLFYNTLFPFLLILILGFISNASYGTTGADAYDYYGVAMLVYSLLNVSLTASNTFMERSLRNSNLRVLHSPVSASYVYLSKIVSTFLFTSVASVLYMALSHWALHVNYGGPNFFYTLIIVLMFDFFSTALGVLFCCIFKSEEAANKILSLITTVLAICGGVFFQIDGMGAFGKIMSAVSPVKWALDAMFRVIWDGNTAAFLPAAAALFALGLLCTLLCRTFFRTEDYV